MKTLMRKTDRKAGLTLPADFASCLVTVERHGEELRVRKVQKVVARRYSFQELMAKVTRGNIHSEIDTGPAVGNEPSPRRARRTPVSSKSSRAAATYRSAEMPSLWAWDSPAVTASETSRNAWLAPKRLETLIASATGRGVGRPLSPSPVSAMAPTPSSGLALHLSAPEFRVADIGFGHRRWRGKIHPLALDVVGPKFRVVHVRLGHHWRG